MRKLWEILKGLGLALLCNLGLLVVALLCEIPGINLPTPTTFLGKFGEILAEWIGVIQLAYLGPLIWRRRQTQKAMTLGLLLGVFLVGLINFWFWKSSRETEAEQPQFNYEYVYHNPEGDLRVNYSSFQKQGEGSTGCLDELFKPGAQTGVDLSQAQYLCLTFTKTPYVKEYQFTLRMPTSPLGAERPVFTFSTTGNMDEVDTYDDTSFPLTAPQTTVTVMGEGHFFGLLRNSMISLDLTRQGSKSGEAYRESPVYLTGIKVVYSSQPVVTPTLTIQEIETKYVKGRKDWHFDGWFEDDKNDNDPLNEEHLKIEGEVLRSLMALGLNGDKRAEELLYHYHLPGSVGEEYSGGLVDWYGHTKKENGQLK